MSTCSCTVWTPKRILSVSSKYKTLFGDNNSPFPVNQEPFYEGNTSILFCYILRNQYKSPCTHFCAAHKNPCPSFFSHLLRKMNPCTKCVHGTVHGTAHGVCSAMSCYVRAHVLGKNAKTSYCTCVCVCSIKTPSIAFYANLVVENPNLVLLVPGTNLVATAHARVRSWYRYVL